MQKGLRSSTLRAVFLVLPFIAAFHTEELYAQDDPLVLRHQRIGDLYEAEKFAELIREIDVQLVSIEGTIWQDSVHRYLYKYSRAHRKANGAQAGIEAGERLYALVKARKNAAHQVEALFDLSWVYYDSGELKQCARVDSIAVVVADSDPKIPVSQRGRARQYVAFDHSVLGDHASSAKWALAALAQYDKGDDILPELRAEAHTAAGAAFWHLGRIRTAEEHYLKSLEILGDGTTEAVLARKVSATGNLGILWQNAGDLTRAKNHYQQSLEFSDAVIAVTNDQFARDEGLLDRSRTYVNLATVYHQLGDIRRARELLDLAWKDRSSVLEADDPQLLSIKERYGDLERATGNLGKARTLIAEYLGATERKYGRNSEKSREAAQRLGDVLVEMGEPVRADSLFALSISGGMASTEPATDAVLVRTFKSRARSRMKSGRWSEALDDLATARRILVNIYDTAHYMVAQVDVLRAEAAFSSGDVPGALVYARKALSNLGERISALSSSAVPRAFTEPHLLPDALYWKVRAERVMAGFTFREEWNADVDLAIAALARNKASLDDEAAKLLLVAAQDRLFDLGLEVAYDAMPTIGEEAAAARILALSEAYRSTLLKGRLNAFKGLRFSGVPDSVVAREQELIAALEINAEDHAAATGLHASEKAYHAFLDGLENEHPAYFALRYSETAITLPEVRKKLLRPGRQLISFAEADTTLFILVVDPTSAHIARVSSVGMADDVRAFNAAIADRNTTDYVALGHRLHQRLIAPVASYLVGSELLIIPEGPLHTINFETLLDAPATARTFQDHLLLKRFSMANLLSATTAVQFAELARDRSTGTLALAPGFTDEVKQRYLASVTDKRRVDQQFLNYVRQPFAMRTAEGLGSVLSADVMLGGDATEQGFRATAQRYGILHLGTHAEMNGSDPMYSRLVLSKDGEGVDPDADGYLHAYEIYELDLRAQLAVLSACETGTGMNDGEGVRSLGYSFAYAGCPSLVMSLWNIDEKVSADVITRFYEHLADGSPKHEALRQAKLDYLDTAVDEMALPYYWAGLILVGDVEPVDIPFWTRYTWWVVGGAFALIMALFMFRRTSRKAV